jgi:hypothetical protein
LSNLKKRAKTTQSLGAFAVGTGVGAMLPSKTSALSIPMIALIALFRLAVEQPSLARGDDLEIAEDADS